MIELIIALVIIGIIWYFISPYIAEPFNRMIVVLIVIVFCVILFNLLFGYPALPNLRLR